MRHENFFAISAQVLPTLMIAFIVELSFLGRMITSKINASVPARADLSPEERELKVAELRAAAATAIQEDLARQNTWCKRLLVRLPKRLPEHIRWRTEAVNIERTVDEFIRQTRRQVYRQVRRWLLIGRGIAVVFVLSELAAIGMIYYGDTWWLSSIAAPAVIAGMVTMIGAVAFIPLSRIKQDLRDLATREGRPDLFDA